MTTEGEPAPRRLVELHPRRGGVPVPVSVARDPLAPAEKLWRRHRHDVLARCESRAATPGLAQAAREVLAGFGEPLGAAALVVALDADPQAGADLTVVVDGLVHDRGLVFAARAGAELGGLALDSEARHGGFREDFVRVAGPSREPLWRDRVPGEAALRRIRSHLAASSDTDYARACAALAEYRDRPVRQRAVVSYLVPTQVDWVAEDCADGGTGPLVYSAHTVEQLDALRVREGCWRPATVGDLLSVLEGVGTGGIASVVGWAESAMRRDRSADVPGETSREQVVELLATVAGDEALVLLLARSHYPGAGAAIERAVARLRAETRAGGPAVPWPDLVEVAARLRHAQPAQHDDFDELLAEVRLLHDADRRTRIEAARSLSDDAEFLVEEYRPVAALALQDRFAVETDPVARLGLVFAVGAVRLPMVTDHHDLRQPDGPPDPPPADDLAWLRGLVDDADTAGADPRIGLAAAVTARWLDRDAPLRDDDLDALVRALRADPAPWSEVLDTHRPYRDPVRCLPSSPAELLDWALDKLATDRGAPGRLASMFLPDPDPRVRRTALRAAAEALRRRRSPTAELVPLLADRLGDLHPDGDFVGRDALVLLAALGTPAVGHVAGLADHYARLLGDDSPMPGLPQIPAATIGTWALARLADPRCVPALRAELDGARPGLADVGRTSDDDDEADVQSDVHRLSRDYAFHLPGLSDVLLLVPQFATELAPHLGRRLRAGDRPEAYLRVVEAWGEAAAAAVPDVLARAEDPETGRRSDRRLLVALALRAIGPAAAAAAPLLRDWLGVAHPDFPVARLAAAHALGAVTGDPAVALDPLADLIARLSGRWRPSERIPSTDPVGYACRVAAELGPLAAAHTDWLRALAFSDYPRVGAARALWTVTGDRGAAATILSAPTPHPGHPRSALVQLADVVPDHPRLVPGLTAVLAADDRHGQARDWRVFVQDEAARRAAERTLSRLR